MPSPFIGPFGRVFRLRRLQPVGDFLAGAEPGTTTRHFPFQHWRVKNLADLGALLDGELGYVSSTDNWYYGFRGVNYVLGHTYVDQQIAANSGYAAPYGFHFEYSSTTAITVDPGIAVDSTLSATLKLLATTTLDYTVNSAAGGNDERTMSGQVATSVGSNLVTGTNTLFLSEFGKRLCTGTIAGAGTTITGTGTKFRAEFKVHDLIGNNSVGYSRISAIASDTSLTIVAAIPGGDPSGGSCSCIENPTMKCGGQNCFLVNSVTSDLLCNLSTNLSNGSALTAKCGGAVQETLNNYHYAVFVVSGPSGTTVICSSQRTTPFGIPGYNTYFRRIGWLTYIGGITALQPFSQEGQQNERRYVWECVQGNNSTTLVTTQSPITWTAVDCAPILPPGARTVLITAAELGVGAGASSTSYRKRGVGDTGTSRNLFSGAAAAPAFSPSNVAVPLDGVQVFEYVRSAGGSAGVTLYNYGYIEDLNK
jgi:hypothetical protein